MDYEITIITLSTQAPVGGSNSSVASRNIPFSTANPSQPLNLDIVGTTTLVVQDDDATLDGILGGRAYGSGTDTNQMAGSNITVGSDQISAGEVVGYDFSGLMLQIEDGVVVAAYEIAFPRTAGTSSLGDIVDNRYSIMVIPIDYTTDDGTELKATAFDPDGTYHFGGNLPYSSSHYAIDYFQADCFASGTRIETPDGPRRVETLKAGDAVLTRDAGVRPLCWAGHVHVTAHRLDLQPNLRPIRLAAGSLGHGVPERDLILSPQHRVLVRSAIAQRMFGEAEVLVAAKHLIGLPGISVVTPADGVTYHHLLLDRHQILRSEGAWTESLYLGPQAMRGLTASARREIAALFPALTGRRMPPQPARRLTTGREGRKLAERHGKNVKPLFQPQHQDDTIGLAPA